MTGMDAPATTSHTLDRLARPVAVATTVLRRERRRCVDEREAFETFSARVERLTPDAAVRTPERTLSPGIDTVSPGGALPAVRAAYAETVMTVPHYREEYGDTLPESMAVEFGREVARGVVASDGLSPGLHETLVAAADLARAERVQFVERLDAETDSVSNTGEAARRLFCDLRTLDETPLPQLSFDELCDLDRAVADLEHRCDRLVTDRQSAIRPVGPGTDDVRLQEYLYQHENHRYPVLASLADLGSVLAGARRRVRRQLTTTV